ncbi:MAG: hypothetical protein M1840_003097 [Geoglossum simile]|nr:MAG: hypothetical protein M1840_003097 [Geoglossum simile]
MARRGRKPDGGRRRVTCNKCGKTFRDTFVLKRHMNTCGIDKPTPTCDTCGQSFARSRNLKRHNCRRAPLVDGRPRERTDPNSPIGSIEQLQSLDNPSSLRTTELHSPADAILENTEPREGKKGLAVTDRLPGSGERPPNEDVEAAHRDFVNNRSAVPINAPLHASNQPYPSVGNGGPQTPGQEQNGTGGYPASHYYISEQPPSDNLVLDRPCLGFRCSAPGQTPPALADQAAYNIPRDRNPSVIPDGPDSGWFYPANPHQFTRDNPHDGNPSAIPDEAGSGWFYPANPHQFTRDNPHDGNPSVIPDEAGSSWFYPANPHQFTRDNPHDGNPSVIPDEAGSSWFYPANPHQFTRDNPHDGNPSVIPDEPGSRWFIRDNPCGVTPNESTLC